MSPIRIMTIVALVASLCATAPADQARDAAERAFRTGERLFNAGEFADAADSFEIALKSMPVPAIMFSAAQAHRFAWIKKSNLADLRRAVELFRKYVADVGSGQRVADATAALATLEPALGMGDSRGGGVAVQARTTALLITSQVEGVTATVDGKPAGQLPLVLEVKPGPHAVVAEAPGYQAITTTATALDGERLPVELELVARPATLRVRGESETVVEVDGRVIGSLPLTRPIEVDAGHHLLGVSRAGRHPISRELDVARGADLDLRVPLATTTQRRMVKWVVIGGGVLALTAGGSALSARTLDSNANALRDRALAGGISVADAQRYDDLRSRRDGAVTVTEVLAGASVVALTVGVLMYVFDHERVERSWGLPATVTPAVTPNGAAVMVGRSF